jgi:hypothetical protein
MSIVRQYSFTSLAVLYLTNRGKNYVIKVVVQLGYKNVYPKGQAGLDNWQPAQKASG